jgi:hypothetical protein
MAVLRKYDAHLVAFAKFGRSDETSSRTPSICVQHLPYTHACGGGISKGVSGVTGVNSTSCNA